jgi:peptide/nickel transport system substrate-binding protein
VRRSLGLVVASMVVLAASGCSGGGPSSSSSSSGSSGSAPPAGQGGTLTVGAAQGVPQLNPALRTFAWEKTLFSLMWDGLTKPAKNGSVDPDLASSWSNSDGGRTWTFKLRSGVKFSNGKDLTASDVVDSFQYYLKPTTATQEAAKLAPIQTVSAPDDHTVRFALKAADQWFPDAIQYVKVLDMASLSTINTAPVVTGPFKVGEFVPNDHLTLVPNGSYFGTKPSLTSIKIVTQTDPTAAVTALRAGDLDVFWAVPSTTAAQIAGGSDPNLKIIQPNGGIGQSPFWNVDNNSAPFNNVKARQALAYAIDREAILKVAYSGQGSVRPTNDFISPDSPWYASGLTDYSYNLDKAKKLFAEAGVTSGSTLTWWGVSNQYPEMNASGQILQQSLKKIGITLKIENKEIGTWAAKFYPAGKSYPGLIVPNFYNNPADPAFSLSNYAFGTCVCNWKSDAFATAYNQALVTPNTPTSAGKQAWAKVQTILNQEVPLMVPIQAATGSAARSKVQGIWLEAGSVLHLEDAWNN